MPPRFFITHSWKDIDFARRLCNDLRRHGLEGFFDAYSIQPGDKIPSEISRGLEACDIYVPVLSFASLASPWCEEEINAAITLSNSPGRNGRPQIIPILIEDCGDELPILLRSRRYIQFAGRYDDALRELLAKDFGLPAAPPPPQSLRKNWLVPFSIVVTLAIIALIVARGILVEQLAELSPPPLASPTLAMQSALPTPPPTPTLASQSAPPVPASIAIVATPPRTSTLTATPAPPTPFLTATSIPGLGIGSTKTAKDGALMMFVPAGEFLMGSSNSDKNAWEAEKPQHTVYLDAFWISKYEVTNALYKKCVDVGRCSAPSHWANGTIPAGKANHPVVNVSWNDAAAYAQWMGGRLPTEAEWEKAACWDEAKKTMRMYPWGDVFDARKANSPESGIGETTPVGKYSPIGDSPYGVSDMFGNVWEWSADWYGETYYSNSPKYNPKGPDSGTFRSLRGGSWPVNQGSAHCASRRGFKPEGSFANIGIRIAQSVP